MTDIRVGDFARAEYVADIAGTIRTLDGVVTSVSEPFTRFNNTAHKCVSVRVADGSEGTFSSTMPVMVLIPAGHPIARKATRQLLDSGVWLNDRIRGELEAVA